MAFSILFDSRTNKTNIIDNHTWDGCVAYAYSEWQSEQTIFPGTVNNLAVLDWLVLIFQWD